MISPTPYYDNLCQSLDAARSLVDSVNPISCESSKEHLMLQGFILISHSIIEEYLENLVLNAAFHAKKKFDESNTVSRTLVGLIASQVVDRISEQGRKKVTSDLASNLSLFSVEAINSFRSKVSSNNGITTKDQRNLFLPIAVDLENVDIGLSQNLHSFGSKRGDVAHNFKLQREETLSDIEGRLSNIRRDLLGLDAEVCASC